MSEPRPRRPSFPGYGVPDDPEGMLPWVWAEERLVGARNYWVAVTGPHATPVWGLWQDGGLLFSCGASSRKARALAQDRRIVVHLESGDDVVIVEGEAEPAVATDEDVTAYERKYEYRPNPGEGWYRVVPRRTLAWREQDYPRSATRFDFRLSKYTPTRDRGSVEASNEEVPMAISAVEGLAAAIKGRVVDRDDPGYDEARALYNGMIDKHPAAVAYCVDEGDVATAIQFAREHGLRIAVRGGGHNGAGLGSVDDGLVIDLSAMNEVVVDPAARMARVQGGTLWKDLDAATHEHDLAVPCGMISTTGVGGLTLGGGIGHLTRSCGLTIDNLVAATVVLANGTVVQTDADRDPDLFWAIRGGGGNFGVVTSFSFRCHPVSTVQAGPVLYDLDDTGELLRWYREFLPAQPEPLSGFFAFLTVPPGPPFPEELHLRKVCGVAWTYAGEDDSPALKEARSWGKPLLDGVAAMPLPAWNSAFDALYPPGDQWYWRGEFIREIPDESIEVHASFGAALPTWKSTMHMYPVDGAASRAGSDETAWAYRNANWATVVAGVDSDAANADAITAWSRAYSDALRPYSLGTGYVNFQMQDEGDRVHAMYGDNYDRLARIKAAYDPDNAFAVNQNIRPAA